MNKRGNLPKIFLAGIFPLLIGITSCSNQEKGIVNSKDDLDISVIGKFNCNTGEFKLTKNDAVLSEVLNKDKWYSKEDFIRATKNNYEKYGTGVYERNPSIMAEAKYRIRVLRSECN